MTEFGKKRRSWEARGKTGTEGPQKKSSILPSQFSTGKNNFSGISCGKVRLLKASIILYYILLYFVFYFCIIFDFIIFYVGSFS